jgi:hypothetical protein
MIYTTCLTSKESTEIDISYLSGMIDIQNIFMLIEIGVVSTEINISYLSFLIDIRVVLMLIEIGVVST